jgi:hypothetical protein
VSNSSNENRQSPADTSRGHTSWCDLAEHALVEENFGHPYGCVGSIVEVPGTIMGAEPGGWWVQEEPGGDARFKLDCIAVNGNLKFLEFSLEDVRTLRGLLRNPAEIATALALTAAALVEYGEDPEDAEREL